MKSDDRRTISGLTRNNEAQAAPKEDASSDNEACCVDPAAPPTLRNPVEGENATQLVPNN